MRPPRGPALGPGQAEGSALRGPRGARLRLDLEDPCGVLSVFSALCCLLLPDKQQPGTDPFLAF